MEDDVSKYEELGLTVDQSDEAWDYLSEMQSGLDKKSDGEQLKKLFNDDHLTFGQTNGSNWWKYKLKQNKTNKKIKEES